MEDEREELQADIEKLHHTLEEDKSLWQYDLVDSDDDSDEDDVLYIDLDKHGSAAASVASLSVRSSGGRTTPSGRSFGSQPATETQSVTTEQEDDREMFREVGVVLESLDSSSLPASFESCLVINRAYQEIIKEHISRIELELADNREAQRRLEEETKDSHLQQKTKKRFPYNTNVPYFKIRYGPVSAPSPNEDVRLKQAAQEPNLDKRPDNPWYQRHKKILVKAVTEDALEKLLRPLLSRCELEEEKLEQTAENSEERQQIEARIDNIDEEIEQKRKTPQDVLLANVDIDRVDWMKISNITFQGRRDWQACRRAWLHSVDPRVNDGDWKPEEEQRLARLIRETNGSNWVYIAQQLGTGRTAFQCLQYYQQNLNPEMLSRPWTKEEDQQLIRVVEKCRQVHFNWTKVASYMEGRSGVQCYRRFTKLDPNTSKGFWTEAEDGQLMAAVKLLGSSNWGRVSELVPGRTREQCRERYLNSLDPKISGQRWTYEEDKTLWQLVHQHGVGSWVMMCRHLPGRTDNQVLQRYRRLQDWKRKAEWFKKQSAKDKELLQGNNLPEEKREKTQAKNWQEFNDVFAVFPDDYRKQQADIEKGEEPVPRPPFMIGLASKSGGKVWERRMNLQKLIESHINKLRDKFNFTNPSVSGVYELQDAISQLSQDCIAQRDELMNRRKESMVQLLCDQPRPSALNVKDLLTVSRGGNPHRPVPRGPQPRKRGRPIAPRLHQSMKLDSELRKILRANLKDRSLKKGRPRRFFWDINGEQKLSDEEVDKLRATTLDLYMKSLGADHVQLTREGRKAFPQLFRKLQDKHHHPPPPPPEDDVDHPGCSKDGRPLRRSLRARKIKQEKEEETEDADPFSLKGQAWETAEFSSWQRQRDYELLEWLVRMQDVDVGFEPQGDLSMDEEIPAVGTVEVSTNRVSEASSSAADVVSEGGGSADVPPIGHGMSLVHASIQQAMEESETLRTDNRDPAENDSVSIDSSGRNEGSRGRTENGVPSSSSTENGTFSAASVDNSANGGRNKGYRQCMVSSRSDGADNITSHTSVPQSAVNGRSPSSSQASNPTPASHHSATSPRESEEHHGLSPEAQGSNPRRPGPSGTWRQLPELPPTNTSMQSFKTLLLRRLGLIKKAGSYYNLQYYLQKKDEQLASIISGGNTVQDISRGTIDLSRLMNRVSQVTDFNKRKKWTRRTDKVKGSDQQETEEDTKEFDYQVLDYLRETEDYKLLEARFQALFTWPALLSTVYPPFQRRDYSEKAGQGTGHPSQRDPNAPHFHTARTHLPLLKPKGFYKYAQKTKEEKAAILEERRRRKVIQEVKRLMADDDDPDPEVIFEPDSDDDNTNTSNDTAASTVLAAQTSSQLPNAGSETSASQSPTPTTSAATAADKTDQVRKRAPKKSRKQRTGPLRKSSRHTERKTYTDRINRTPKPKPKPQPEKEKHSAGAGVARKEKHKRPHVSRFVRRNMINAMVQMKTLSMRKIPRTTAWNPGGYVSEEEDGEEVMREMEGRENWVEQLPQDQLESMVAIEQGSVLVPPPTAALAERGRDIVQDVVEDAVEDIDEDVDEDVVEDVASGASDVEDSSELVTGVLHNSVVVPGTASTGSESLNNQSVSPAARSSQAKGAKALPSVVNARSCSAPLSLSLRASASSEDLSLFYPPVRFLPQERAGVCVKPEIPDPSPVDAMDIASYVPAALSLPDLPLHRRGGASSVSGYSGAGYSGASNTGASYGSASTGAATVSVVPNTSTFLPAAANANPASSVGLALPAADPNTVVLLIANGSHIPASGSGGLAPVQISDNTVPVTSVQSSLEGYQPLVGAGTTQRKRTGKEGVGLESEDDGEPTVASLLAAKKRKQK